MKNMPTVLGRWSTGRRVTALVEVPGVRETFRYTYEGGAGGDALVCLIPGKRARRGEKKRPWGSLGKEEQGQMLFDTAVVVLGEPSKLGIKTGSPRRARGFRIPARCSVTINFRKEADGG